MNREVDLKEITDGKFYTLGDMVKVGCGDCNGCHVCCTGMGNSIVLDPLDVHRICGVTGKDFETLLSLHIELNMVEGVILPNIKSDEKEECTFLNGEGRCSIHSERPGICRIFPLGRVYDDEGFKYVLQTKECVRPIKTKVKVERWIDTPDIKRNQMFILEWHRFIKLVSGVISTSDEDTIKSINMFILNMFYLTPFRRDVDFYEIFNERLKNAKSALDIA